MGYFSNGTEGGMYEADYCARCIHGDQDGAADCSVWFVHENWSYEFVAKPGGILDMLIPRTEDGLGNEQCRMFLKREPGVIEYSLPNFPHTERVERIFRQAGAVREGHFRLTSGRHSPIYWEKMRVLQHPRLTARLCRPSPAASGATG